MQGEKVVQKFNCAGCHMFELGRWDIRYRPGDFEGNPPPALYPFLDQVVPPGATTLNFVDYTARRVAANQDLLARKPVVVLVSDVFDQRPYLRLRIKAYAYDHRFEPRMQSDITARAKTEFLRLGLLDDWRESAASDEEADAA